MNFQPNVVLRGDQMAAAYAQLYGGGDAHLSRAAFDDDPYGKVQGGIQPFITEVIKGYPLPTMPFGQLLFRRVGVPTIEFKYKVFNKASLAGSQDTRRGPNAPFKIIRRDYEHVAEKLERRGMVALADRDELANARAAAPGFIDNLAARKAFEARWEVIKDLEVNEMASLILAAGSYGSTLTITATNEWDNQTNGNSRDDVQNLGWQVANKNGLQLRQIGIALTHASFQAAQDDPTLKAALVAGGTGTRANLGRTINADDLRDYWGVGEVQVGDFFYVASGDPDAAMASAYGDIAVAYVIPGPVDGFDMRETSQDGFVNFAWNAAGFALEPVFKGVEVQGVATSWLYPYETWETPAVVNTDALGLISNTQA